MASGIVQKGGVSKKSNFKCMNKIDKIFQLILLHCCEICRGLYLFKVQTQIFLCHYRGRVGGCQTPELFVTTFYVTNSIV